MKKILIFATILLAAFACTKEANVNDTVQNTKESKDVYVINASVAPLVSEEGTKAAISEADGTFSWATGDAIAVTSSVTNKIYKFVYDGTSFVLDSSETMEESPVFSTAVFPYSEAGTLSYPTSLTSGTAALLAEGVRLSGTFTDNSTLTFQHAYSLLHVRFANAPSFTGAIKFEGTKSVTVSVTPDADNNADAYIPVDASETAFTLSLIDNSNNVIMKKSTNGKSFAIGTLKTMKPLTVGYIMTINGAEADEHWDELRLHVWNSDDDSQNFDIKSEALDSEISYPWKLNKVGNSYYAVLSSEFGSWVAEGAAVGLYLEGKDSWSVKTDRFYLYRNGEFTIAAGQGLKTDYRVYAKIAAGKRTYWGEGGIKISENYQSKFDSKDMIWVYGNTASTGESDSEEALYYYDISNGGEWFYWDNLNFHMWDPDNTGWNKDLTFPADGSYRLTREVMVIFN